MKIFGLNKCGYNIYFCRNYCNRLNFERLAGFPNTYGTKDREDYWKNIWEQNNYFNGEKDEFSVKLLLPPPNVTGVLHLGHALTVTIQDVLARWHRMRGEPVVWVPGLDHAGIATQVVVEKYLSATKHVTRYDLGKEQFIECVEKWKNEKGSEIRDQLKSLAATLDWSKEYFTMSKEHNNAVNEAFITLNNRNLLYRKKDLVNWSPSLRSTISDIEVDYLTVTKKTEIQVPGYQKKISFGEIADVAFSIKDSPDKLIVSTTRVETMMGDVAIAVHPEDPRHSRLIGQQVYHPLREIFIPIVGDSTVKQDFGTGAVKITPAHSHQDLEIATRHNLEVIEVIGEDGVMNDNADSFKKLPRFIARKKILDTLKNKGALVDVKDHTMQIPICSRSGDVIEYLIKEQWFMKMQKMAETAANAVRNAELKLDSARYEEQWFEKLDNIKDWCVSRQLWWGHQIPAYFCQHGDAKHWIIAQNDADAREIAEKKFGTAEIQQDTDVLDTWFSAALLPLSAFGWPNNKFREFYPLTLMETGHDILFYWVARMAMLCTELVGELPFKEVLLHGVLCDTNGRKMSKSVGNVILPEFVINGISLKDLNAKAKDSFDAGILSDAELKRTLLVNAKSFPKGIPECGIDALRFTLCSHNIKNEKIRFTVDECDAHKRFCNKIWQASKYVLLVTDEKFIELPKKFTVVDRWILSRLSLMIRTVNEAFEMRNFHTAISAIKQFFYWEYCDFYVEATKPGFDSRKDDVINSHRYCLIKCLEVSLRILAPIMPYLSEELYSRLAERLPNFSVLPSVMRTSFPTIDDIDPRDCQLESQFEQILKIVATLRVFVSHVNKKLINEVHIVLKNTEDFDFYRENRLFILGNTRINCIRIFVASDYVPKNDCICSSEDDYNLYYLMTNKEALWQVQDKVKSKKMQIEDKLESLLNTVSKKSEKDEEKFDINKIKAEETIKNLQLELSKYPKFV